MLCLRFSSYYVPRLIEVSGSSPLSSIYLDVYFICLPVLMSIFRSIPLGSSLSWLH